MGLLQPMQSKPFGDKMRRLREELGISLREFCRRAEMSPSFVSDVENGRRYPSRMRLIRIAKTLGIPVSELVDLDPRVTLVLLRGMLEREAEWGPVFRRIHAAAANGGLTPASLMQKLPGES